MRRESFALGPAGRSAAREGAGGRGQVGPGRAGDVQETRNWQGFLTRPGRPGPRRSAGPAGVAAKAHRRRIYDSFMIAV